MSHITIIISKGGGGGGLVESDHGDTIDWRYVPDDGLSNKDIAKEVLRRLDAMEADEK